MSREIVFDVETTGTRVEEGHRIIQIGAVELIDLMPSGREYVTLVNPERPIDPGAMAVHGITDEMVRKQPAFGEVIDDFLRFVGDAPLVAHNAEFDRSFLNAELMRLGREPLPAERFVDTLVIARQRFPGQRNSLDHLCRRFGIDLSEREKHDALVDCRLLARVYLELKGGRQAGLDLIADAPASGAPTSAAAPPRSAPRPPRPHAPSEAERARHEAFIAQALTDALWLEVKRP
ncbi:MAG: DNA polymerase III subunit epsilon [Alphaproteobacteria bacterium]|nr:MAG: DNA polymerase III subunit epsilon [Alphaproteobacteria bacterium]